ncbi:MFS transporter [Streptomyces sp. NPDC050504]|uniref:MFS transporter n=1 Tax=Streptomyces sp. NPDC050504 TaxID=3365618 RepID=UPI0037A339E2
MPSAPPAASRPTSTPAAAPAAAAPAAPRRPVPVGWLVLLATPIAAGANAPVLILPDMARSLGVPTTTATWLVTVFAWAMAVGTPLAGGLLRRAGVRTTLKLGAALVTVGSVLVATAPWLPLAVAGRAAQALGGAALIGVAMNLAGTPRRLGAVTAGFGVLGATGPLLGSTLADAASWRVSLLASAVALAAVPAVYRRDPELPRTDEPFDGRGAALLVTLVTGLVLIPTAPLPGAVTALGAAALLAAHLRARPDGFVPTALLRTPSFLASALLASAVSTSYFALLFAVPRLLASGTEWSTTTIATAQLLALLTGSVLSWLLSAASARMPRGAVLTVLLALGAAAPLTAWLTPWPGLLLPVATTAVLAAVAGNATLSSYAAKAAANPTQRPTAIGLVNLAYQLGGAFGPVIAALLTL